MINMLVLGVILLGVSLLGGAILTHLHRRRQEREAAVQARMSHRLADDPRTGDLVRQRHVLMVDTLDNRAEIIRAAMRTYAQDRVLRPIHDVPIVDVEALKREVHIPRTKLPPESHGQYGRSKMTTDRRAVREERRRDEDQTDLTSVAVSAAILSSSLRDYSATVDKAADDFKPGGGEHGGGGASASWDSSPSSSDSGGSSSSDSGGSASSD